MRRPTRLVVLSILLLSLTLFARSEPLALADKGQSTYQIVLPAKASPSEQRGAGELQTYIQKITGAKLPIATDATPLPERAILVGQTRYTGDLLKTAPPANLGPEGFVLRTVGPHLLIAGSPVRGTMYGSTALLERLGVRWYTPKVTFVPKRDTLTIADLDETQVPAFEYRCAFVTEAFNKEWGAHLRLNAQQHQLDASTGGSIRYSHFAHTFDEIYPRDRFAEHPEYFSLIKGKRTNGYVQRCLSNPEFLKLTIRRVREWIKEDPDAQIHSVTQNDTYKWCECDDCQRLTRQYGGHSGLYLWFVNQVAEEIEKTNPDKLIDTFAYQFTEAPPTGIKPRKNVRVRLCPIAACAAHPFDQCDLPATQAFMKNLEGWSKLTDTLYIWHYNTNFPNYLLPYPDFGEFPADTRLYRKMGVRGIFFEGAYGAGGGGSFADLQAYVMAKLLWNPEQDEKPLIREWHNGVFAEAAPPMLEWFDLLHAKVADPKNHFTCFGRPKTFAHLAPDVLAAGDKLFDRAQQLAAANPLATEYVEKARLCLRYAKLFQNPTTGPEFTSFVADLRKHGIGNIGEHVSVDAWEKTFREKNK